MNALAGTVKNACCTGLLCLAMLVSSPQACAADAAAAYPNKPIRLVVTFVAGGGVDLLARTLAPKITEAWGQQVLVDNRAGGGGIIGTEIVARATPDGYTLLFGTSSGMVNNPLLRPKLPYDPVRDFAPVSQLVVTAMLLAAHPSIGASTVQELVAVARRRPGEISYASAGPGAPNHIATELLKLMTKTDMVHVPYKGSGAALTDLLGGQVQVMFNPMAPVLPHVRSGKLRALAVGNDRRSAAMPELPTVAESGLPGFDSAPWYALFAPAGTPRAVVAKLNAEIGRILAEPAMAQRLTGQGSEPRPSTPEALSEIMRADTKRIAPVIRALGLRVD